MKYKHGSNWDINLLISRMLSSYIRYWHWNNSHNVEIDEIFASETHCLWEIFPLYSFSFMARVMSLQGGYAVSLLIFISELLRHLLKERYEWQQNQPLLCVFGNRCKVRWVTILAGNQNTWGTTWYLSGFNFSDYDSSLTVSADQNNTHSNFFSLCILSLICSARSMLRFR